MVPNDILNSEPDCPEDLKELLRRNGLEEHLQVFQREQMDVEALVCALSLPCYLVVPCDTSLFCSVITLVSQRSVSHLK